MGMDKAPLRWADISIKFGSDKNNQSTTQSNRKSFLKIGIFPIIIFGAQKKWFLPYDMIKIDFLTSFSVWARFWGIREIWGGGGPGEGGGARFPWGRPAGQIFGPPSAPI